LNIFITSSNTNAGKTNILIMLIESLSKLGFLVSAYKPIETGIKQDKEEKNDSDLILESLKNHNTFFEDKNIDEITTYRFDLAAAPYIAKKKTNISIDKIIKRAKVLRRESKCDILLIEGAGGLYTPISKDESMADLAKHIADKVLFVTTAKLGTITETILGLKAMDRESFSEYSWCVNDYDEKDNFAQISKPFFDDYFKNYLILPNDLDKLTKELVRFSKY
jgi:dethiobiotin synthetase